MEFQRTFHAVGQGAFYSEEIRNDDCRLFRMVYDCGDSFMQEKALKAKVRSDLGAAVDVDLLIISHFDSDHINGVKFLQPKRIMIPFLSEDVCIFLMVQAKIDGVDFDIDMALHPELIFPDSHIIKVKPEEEGQDGERLSPYEINLDIDVSPKIEEVDSNREFDITHKGETIWEYIAFNPNMERYAQKFKEAVDKSELPWESLKVGGYLMKHFDEIKKIYKDLRNKNHHSLAVYSGAKNDVRLQYISQNNRLNFRCWDCPFPHYDFHYRKVYDCPSSLYFGDATIGPDWLHRFYMRLDTRLEKVSFIQIPHHGSYSSNVNRIAKDSCFENYAEGCICVISHGERNSFGHPSSTLVNSLLRQGMSVVYVTETPATMFSMGYYISQPCKSIKNTKI